MVAEDYQEVKVIGVYEETVPSPGAAQTFVLFQDNEGRKVPIWIGRYEAYGIQMAMAGGESERPMTYDLLKVILDRAGMTVERVVIHDLQQDTFYAKLIVARNGESLEIDCRPSDGLNVALRAQAPIYMAETVIEAIQQSRPPDQE